MKTLTQKNTFSLFICLIIFFSSNGYAWDNDLVLKGGINVSWVKLSGLNDSVEHAPTAGFNTHFGYKWERWAFDVSSYINFSGFDDLDLKAQGRELSGVDGDVRNLSIVPLLKYYTNYEIKPTWEFYTGIGPSWSLLTIRLEDDITIQGFGGNDKFVYESHGFSVAFGIEEQTAFKQMHPVFLELNVQYLKSYELTTVDASNTAETVILSIEEIKQIETIYYILSMGIAIF